MVETIAIHRSPMVQEFNFQRLGTGLLETAPVLRYAKDQALMAYQMTTETVVVVKTLLTVLTLQKISAHKELLMMLS